MHANGINRKPARWVTLALAGALMLLLAAMSGTAVAKDRNHDQIPDRWEKRNDLSLKVDQANRDQDADDMPNLGEYEGGTDPRDEDTEDGDGVPDSEENAGEVASFTPGAEEGTGTLVISLYSGETLTGEVTEDTMIAVLSASDEEALAKAARPGPPPEFGGGEETEPTEPGEDTEPVEPGEETGSGPGGRPHNVGQHDCPGAEEGSVDDLVPGAVIHQATLDVTANGNEFRRIEVASSE